MVVVIKNKETKKRAAVRQFRYVLAAKQCE